MMVIGLTGPMGAGKDTVAKILARQGAIVIDVDKVAHTLYCHQSAVWGELVKAFGSKILVRDGQISRKKLGEIVFADKEKLKKLNSIVHPHLKEAILKMTEAARRETRDVVINAAVLKEIGLVDCVDEVWVVMANRANRLRRLMKKGLSKQEALKRINAQAPQKEYLTIADRVIRNDRGLRELIGVISEISVF